MKKITFYLSLIALLVTACDNEGKGAYNGPGIGGDDTEKVKVGEQLPAWEEGCFDIHFINTARGECCFYILPDGTTLLVDAGEVEGDSAMNLTPNKETRPYITYANYIKHFMPKGKTAIDYCAPSHFHTDHIGSKDMVTETAPAGYRKSGLTALYDLVPYNHILDRAYPDYPTDDKHETVPRIDGQLAVDWGKFVKWGVKEKEFTAERFTPGEKQIVMVNNPSKYSDFSILNICANGFVVGKESNGKNIILGKKSGVGNAASCGFHVKYGKFDYIACGDLVSTAQNLVARYFRDFIGDGNLDSFKCHHHLASNGWGSEMQELNFNPRFILNHCFSTVKPDVGQLLYVLPIKNGFFATNLHPEIVANSDFVSNNLIKQINGYDGHIVLRVEAGGSSFSIYMLDDSDFEYRVKSTHGPYKSK